MRAKPWDVPDGLWERIEPLLPKRERRFRYPGRKRLEIGRRCRGSCSCCTRGSRWEHLPQELGFGSGMTCWRRLESGSRRASGSGCTSCCWRELQRRGRDRVVAGDRRLEPRAGEKGGSKTGPSPVDRGRAGCKHHLLVDGSGIPLAWTLTGGNRNDVTQLIPLLDRVPPVRGRVGRPRRRPDTRRRRPRLRPRQVPPPRLAARHQARDRPPPDRARLRARPRPLGRRTHLRLAAQPQPTARPLRPPRTTSTKPSSPSAAASSAPDGCGAHSDSSSKTGALKFRRAFWLERRVNCEHALG